VRGHRNRPLGQASGQIGKKRKRADSTGGGGGDGGSSGGVDSAVVEDDNIFEAQPQCEVNHEQNINY
jgi:hypothetical protein